MPRWPASLLGGVLLIAGCAVGDNTDGSRRAGPPSTDSDSPRFGGIVRELPAAGSIEVRDGRSFASGKVLAADGSPAAGASVALSVPLGSPLDLGRLAPAVFGAACDADAAAQCVAPGAAARVGADGSYSLELEGTNDAYLVSAQRPDGSFVQARVTVPQPGDGGRAPVPLLRFWDTDVRLTEGGTSIKVDFDVLADSGYGDLDFYTLWAWPPDVAAGTNPLVEKRVVQPGDSFDVALVEDAPAHVRLSAEAEGSVDGAAVRLTIGSRHARLATPREPPPSRNAACGSQRPDGGITPLQRCPLTDGNLQDEFGSAAAATADDRPVVVDVGRTVDARLVVVHDCSIACTVEVSEDGVTWRARKLPLVDHDFPGWPNPGRVRYLRMDSYDVRTVRELSVWECRSGTGGR